jgi:hypothetical protein
MKEAGPSSVSACFLGFVLPDRLQLTIFGDILQRGIFPLIPSVIYYIDSHLVFLKFSRGL